MVGSQVRFEWHIAEDERLWTRKFYPPEATSFTTEEQTSVDRRVGFGLLRVLALLLVGMMALTGAAQSPAQLAMMRAESGVMTALALEAEARRTNDSDLDGRLIDSRIGRQWQRIWSARFSGSTSSGAEQGARLLSIEEAGPLVVASVLDHRASSSWRPEGVFRETRFYRETDAGWLRTLPDSGFWGAQTIHESGHVRFDYFAQDASALFPNIGKIETLFSRLYELVGLDLPPEASALVIEIRPELVNSRGEYDERMGVTSPTLAAVPAEFSDADYLLHEIAERLIYRVFNQARDRYLDGRPFSFKWRIMQSGYRSWLQAELLGQASPWDRQADAVLADYHRQNPHLTLDGISHYDEELMIDRKRYTQRAAAARSIFDYAAATYGRDRILTLAKTILRMKSWPQLITDELGVSVEEFEAGWNGYLAEKYQ